MSELIYEVKDVGGILRVYDTYSEIERKGVFAKMSHGFTKGTKTFYYKDITGVQIKEPKGTYGYIQFTMPGGNEAQKGVLEAQTDENTFMIRKKKNYKILQEIKEFIDSAKNESAAPAQATSAADELRKYKELMDDGIITEEQFNKKRDELLG